MTNLELDRAVGRWMAAELLDNEDEAEAAFLTVARALPRFEPSSVLSGRLIRATSSARVRRTAVTRVVRVGAILGAAVTAFVLVYVASMRLGPMAARGAVGLLDVAFQGFVWMTLAANSGLDVWSVLARAGRLAGAAAGTPRVAVILVTIELAGALALYGLHQLLAQEKKESR